MGGVGRRTMRAGPRRSGLTEDRGLCNLDPEDHAQETARKLNSFVFFFFLLKAVNNTPAVYFCFRRKNHYRLGTIIIL